MIELILNHTGILILNSLSIEGRYTLEKGLTIFNPCSLILKLIIALTDENTLFTVELDIPCSINQSRNFPASNDE